MWLRGLIIIGAISSLAGCVAGAVGAAGAVGVAAVQDRTIGESLDDATASNELKTKLMASSPQRFNEVDVEVAGRVALLTGRVPDAESKIEAERIAWTVKKIEDVGNEIKVRGAGGVGQNLNDEWITARVRSRLFTDTMVKSLNINIETYDGTVYLMGIARNNAELKRAAEHASYVKGVKEVVSYIKVQEPLAAGPKTSQNTQNPYQPQ